MSSSRSQQKQLQTIAKFAIPINLRHITTSPRDTKTGYDAIIQAIGPSQVVLIGDASHGTKEFYRERALLTKRLIEEKEFTSVIVEADWSDAYRVNKYVMGDSKDKDANAALSDFVRFPTWMWRNTEVLKFIAWLKKHNDRIKDVNHRTGFYGMDLYCLNSSAHAVIQYLEKVDPSAAKVAKNRYECFLQYGSDTQAYAMAATFGLGKSCECEVVNTLVDLRKKAGEYLKKDGYVGEDELFFATENAEVVKDAEEYYRTMMLAGPKSWNLRDKHMVKTIVNLMEHRKRMGDKGKVVVWAHNSHLGDARCTDMGARGEWNVGQLMREKFGDNVFNVGMMTHTGTVSAAHNWDCPRETMKVLPGREDSYEGLLVGYPEKEYVLLFNKTGLSEKGDVKKETNEELVQALKKPLLERYIGVIYRPKTEYHSHYSTSTLSKQFDAVVYISETSALQPLDVKSFYPELEDENVPDLFSLAEPAGL